MYCCMCPSPVPVQLVLYQGQLCGSQLLCPVPSGIAAGLMGCSGGQESCQPWIEKYCCRVLEAVGTLLLHLSMSNTTQGKALVSTGCYRGGFTCSSSPSGSSTPEETVSLLVRAGLFDSAITLCQTFKLPLTPIFEGLTFKYVRVPSHLGGHRAGGMQGLGRGTCPRAFFPCQSSWVVHWEYSRKGL